MTTQEAIKELKQIPAHIGDDCDGYELKALHMAIKALELYEHKDEMLEALEDIHQCCLEQFWEYDIKANNHTEYEKLAWSLFGRLEQNAGWVASTIKGEPL